MNPTAFKPFPVPVVAALGPGSQPADEEGLELMSMPQGMDTYRPPPLPEPEEMAVHTAVIAVLRQALDALRQSAAGTATQVIDVNHLNDAERTLLNQVLGEGDVAAQVLGQLPGEVLIDDTVQAQESVFAGVWRVLHQPASAPRRDTLEIGRIPAALAAAALDDAARATVDFKSAPAGVMNSPSLLTEINDAVQRWHEGAEAHVLNLSLLPITPEDSAHLDGELGAGRVVILSRGYGNCRITNTRAAHTWRVTYFNSSDLIILDTLEICGMPEVACAAPEDLEDSAERLAEVLDWVATS